MNTVSLLQSAAFRISLVVIPVLAAAEAAALRVECALNILVSIPALSNKDFSHLARVDEHTGLCGLTTRLHLLHIIQNSWRPLRGLSHSVIPCFQAIFSAQTMRACAI